MAAVSAALSTRLLLGSLRSTWLACGGAVVAAVGWPPVWLALWAWSEPAFSVLTLALLCALAPPTPGAGAAIRPASKWRWSAAAGLAALAPLQRYARSEERRVGKECRL